MKVVYLYVDADRPSALEPWSIANLRGNRAGESRGPPPTLGLRISANSKPYLTSLLHLQIEIRSIGVGGYLKKLHLY